MPEADDWARASEMKAHLEWPSADAGDGEGSDETTPTTRAYFLGQLSEDEAQDLWADDPPDDVWAGDHPHGEVDGADPEGVLPDGTELHDAVATDGDATELSLASVADQTTRVSTGPMHAVGARKASRAARKQRGKARLSRIALVAGVVAAFAAGTAVYVGTRANANDDHARRPTSTSFERRSPSTTATAVAGSDPAPGTEPAPDSAGLGSVCARLAARDGLGSGRGARQRRADLAAGAKFDRRTAEHRRSAQRATAATPDVSGAPGPLPLARDGGER